MGKPRFAARVDTVHPAIVEALRVAGPKVLVLDVGEEGAPDILVGWLGTLTLLELKSPGGKLSGAQRQWHEAWARVGVKVVTCKTPREAFDAVGLTGPKAEANLAAMRSLVSGRKRIARTIAKAQPNVKTYREGT